MCVNGFKMEKDVLKNKEHLTNFELVKTKWSAHSLPFELMHTFKENKKNIHNLYVICLFLERMKHKTDIKYFFKIPYNDNVKNV